MSEMMHVCELRQNYRFIFIKMIKNSKHPYCKVTRTARSCAVFSKLPSDVTFFIQCHVQTDMQLALESCTLLLHFRLNTTQIHPLNIINKKNATIIINQHLLTLPWNLVYTDISTRRHYTSCHAMPTHWSPDRLHGHTHTPCTTTWQQHFSISCLDNQTHQEHDWGTDSVMSARNVILSCELAAVSHQQCMEWNFQLASKYSGKGSTSTQLAQAQL